MVFWGLLCSLLKLRQMPKYINTFMVPLFEVTKMYLNQYKKNKNDSNNNGDISKYNKNDDRNKMKIIILIIIETIINNLFQPGDFFAGFINGDTNTKTSKL